MKPLLSASMALLLTCMMFSVGCKTRAEKNAEISNFIPATFVSRLQADKGRYPTLLSPASRALWMHDEVIAAKEEEAGTTGQETAEVQQENLRARESLDNLLIIECTMESCFGDSSIAYDVVGMKGADAYLLTAEGRKVMPVQVIIGKCEEEPVNALRLFRRTNLLVFERRNLTTGEPVFNKLAPSARLVVSAFETDFYFEWPGVPFEQEKTWQLTCRDSARAVAKTSKTGASKLYEVGRTVAHHTN